MKLFQQITLSVLVTAVVLVLIPKVRTSALDEVWKSNEYCDENSGFIAFYKAKDIIFDPYKNEDYGAKFLTDPALNNYCVDTSIVGSLVDYHLNVSSNSNVSNNPNSPGSMSTTQDTSLYGYCGIVNDRAYVTAYEIDTTKSISVAATDLKYLVVGKNLMCCPQGSNYAYQSGGSVSCCPANAVPSDGYCSNNEVAIAGISASSDKLGSKPFPTTEVRYSCPESACMVKNSVEVDADENRTNITEDEKNSNYGCYDSISISSAKDISTLGTSQLYNGMYCYNGHFISRDVITEWGVLIGLYNSCQDISDKDDQQNCINCYKNCIGKDSCSINYSSLGCVDSTASGLTTRVFQIGIGIIGAIGMLRIMQAAIMRQSGEPAKIKESYDIIASVIIGLIVLIFGVVILRFVGIQILPFDFLK